MRFSVLTPVYNGARTLADAARTLEAQGFQDWEWVIVDDGSRDDTGRIADGLAVGDKRIRVIHQANGGVSVARNRAMDEARGEWIVWLDADDAYTPDALAQVDALIAAHPEIDALEFPYLQKESSDAVQGAVGETRICSGTDAFQRLYVDAKTRGQHWQPWRFVYRRGCFPRFREGVIHEDVDVLPAHLLTLERVCLADRPFYIYTPDSEGAATQHFTPKRVADILDVTEHNWDACPKLRPMLIWNIWGYYRAAEEFPEPSRGELLAQFQRHPEYLGLTAAQARRHPGLEVARILAIFLVVLQHIVFLGGILNEELGTMQRLQMRSLEAVSQCCVDVFGLLSGFVMAGASVGIFASGDWRRRLWHSWRNFGRLWLQLWFTGMLVLGGCWAASRLGALSTVPSQADWCTALLPLLKNEYWYFTGYLFIVLLAPCLLRIARWKFSKWLAVALFVVICGITACPGGKEILPLNNGYSAAWLVILAFWGMVLRRYFPPQNMTRKAGLICLGIAAIMVGITVLQRIVMAAVPALKSCFQDEWTLHHYTSPTIVVAAAGILLACSAFRTGHRGRKIIYALSSCAFGVYLLHVQPFFFEHCFKGRFDALASVPWYLFGIAILAVAVVIFAVCVAVEKARQAVAKKVVHPIS